MFKILELKNADTGGAGGGGTWILHARTSLGGGQKASDDLQGSRTQSGRRLLVGTGF